MKDKKPVIIGVLSVVLLILIAYILLDGRNDTENENGLVEEPPVVVPEEPAEPAEPVEPEPDPEPEPAPDLPIWYEDSEFELPIIGAAGYPSVDQALYTEPNESSQTLGVLPAGTPFEIRAEQGEWWYVETAVSTGWLEHKFAFINLPDVIPSIIYNHTNSYDSQFRSSYYDIPDLTGLALYEMRTTNERLDKEEFIMPLLYQSAKKIALAQRLALENSETLVMVETFRPRDTQLLVNEALSDLAEENEEVEQGITEEPWSMTWFINMHVSNHQRGLAVDISLARIDELSERIIGDYHVPEVLAYTEYQMHTPIHELSIDSAIFDRPIAARDRYGWRELDVNPEMTEASLRMQEYLVVAGFTPLASEWWHFNDVDALEDLDEDAGTGEFRITELLNSEPYWEEVQEFIN